MSATFILDGSNLAWLGPGDGPALAPVDAIADALRAEWPGCKVITVCDASLRHRLDAGDKAEHKRRADAGELVEAPADEDADAYILDAARRLGGCVVTRDLYRDRREARAGIPMLRPALIGGAVILGDPKVFATADSDRGEAMPADALGARVPPAPLPGGAPVEATADEAPPADDPEPTDGGDDTPEAAPPEPPPKPKRKRKPKPPPEPEPDPEPEPAPAPRRSPRPRPASAPEAGPPARTAFGAALLLAIAAAVGLLAWWLFSEPPPPTEPPEGVLFARNCKGWRLADGEERIVFHARPDQCATSIAAAGPDRLLVTVVDGPGPRTEGRVRLVTAEAGAERAEVELTRGRRGQDEMTPETADARIAGFDPAAGLVAIEVSPAADQPSIWVARTLDGDVRAHTEQAAGVALTAGRAAVLRHHCQTATGPGCGAVHIAADLPAAIAAAESGPPPDEGGPRWAGPAAFSPDGGRLAVAEAFDGPRGGVVIIDVATGARRRVAFQAREAGRVTGLAWIPDGLRLGVGDPLYGIDPDADTGWQPVARKAARVMPTWSARR